MAQLTYSTATAVGAPGLKVDSQDDDVLSRINDEASLNIPFGVAVCRGDADDHCELPNNTADYILGVSVRTHALGTNYYAPKDMVNVLRKGTIWVTTEDACTEGGAVYVRHGANGGNTQLGAFRATDDSTYTSLLTNARWASSAGAGGLAKLELRGMIGPMT